MGLSMLQDADLAGKGNGCFLHHFAGCPAQTLLIAARVVQSAVAPAARVAPRFA
jgi:hypothetical protein